MTEETTTAEGATTFRHRSGQSLRQRAEDVVQKQPEEMEEIAAGDIQDLIHELQVHQVELEIQNEELRQAQQALERSRDRYSDLYEFAPVGYLTLNRKGTVLEANLTLATLLGVERVALIDRPLSRFIVSEDQDVYYHHRRRLFETQQPQSCELRMVRGDGSRFWVQIEARASVDSEDEVVCQATLSDVTTRKRAESAREESLARYADITARVLVGVYVFWIRADGEMAFEYVSDRWCEIHQLRRADVLADVTVTNALVHPDDLEDFLACNREAHRDRKTFSWEGRLVIGGETRWLQIESTCEVFANGDTRWFGVTQDITERKQMEEALRESEEQHRRLFETMSIGVVYHQISDHAIISANPAAERLLGLSLAQMQGKTSMDPRWKMILEDGTPVPGSDHPTMIALRTEEQVGPVTRGIYIPERDAYVWLSITAIPLFQPGAAHPFQVYATFDDITERKQAEEALRQQKELLESALESLTHPFLVIDAEDYTVEMANSAALPADGLTEGMTCHQLTHRRDTPCEGEHHPCPLDEVKATQASVKMEHVHHAQDGSRRYVELHGYPIFGKDGNVVQMIEYALDVTERKRAEAQLQEYAEHLEQMVDEKVQQLEQERTKIIQMDKLASLGQLATSIAHELNQPLTAITFDADYLKTLAGQAAAAVALDLAELMKIGQEIEADVARCRRIIDHLRSFGRVATEDTAPVDLNQPLADSFILIGAQLRDHQVTVELHLAEHLPYIQANPHKLEQVFLNLIANAEYALQEAAEQDGREKILTLSTRQEGDWVIAEVRDNGLGIPEDVQKRLFEPFFTTKPEGAGTGLGLSICDNIVTDIGGEIACQSTEGEGTTFTLRLPVESTG